MTESPDVDEVVIPRSGDRVLWVLLDFGSACFVAVVGTVGVVRGSVGGLFLLLLGVPFLAFGIGELRLAFRAGPDGVDFRNHFLRYHYDWNDVFEFRGKRHRAGFNSQTSHGLSGSVIEVVTVDWGEKAASVAVSFLAGRENGAKQQERLDALNALRRRYTTREW